LTVFAVLVAVSAISLPPYVRAKKSEHWPTAAGIISANWLRVGIGKRGRFYHPEIAFRYRVGGADYQGSRISFKFDRDGPQREAQSILDRYPMGSAVKVYYDPANPAFGILQPGRNDEMQLLYNVDLWLIGIFSFLLLTTWLWYDDRKKEVAEFSTPPVDRR
jgi:Protein of unknown function (DUF3592)